MINFLITGMIDPIIRIIEFAIIGRVIVSWLATSQLQNLPKPIHYIVAILHYVTEPILSPLRKALPSFGMLDLSPMIAILGLIFIRGIIRWLLI